MVISSRLVLRTGFGLLMALLVLSAIMAWRIQEGFSERSYETHLRSASQQEMLYGLRRLLWQVGIIVRDHYLNPKPDAARLKMQLDELHGEANQYLAHLRNSNVRPEVLAEVEEHFLQLWSAARTSADGITAPEDRFSFVQKQIVPRRDEAGRLLREIERANAQSMAASQQEFQQNRTAATRRLLLVLGVCLIAGIYVAWYSMRYAERLEGEAQSRFIEVSDAKQQLEHLSTRLMDVQEEERTRLSRELHDEIVQNLAVLKMEITQAQTMTGGDPQLNAPLSRARTLAENTVQTVRNISLLLRPSLLDDLGLGPALQWQAEEFTRRTGVPCELRDGIEDETLSEAVKTCVYRVTQEALRNCEKHSRATSVRVTVQILPTQDLEVLVEDNGQGFPNGAARHPASLGVLGMKERAAALGGTLMTTNRAGGGAAVRMLVPLSRSETVRSDGVHA